MAETSPLGGTDPADALAMEVDVTSPADADRAGLVRARVHEGFDVFGIPHGGYLAALAARAVLLVSDQPDLFTVTVHYLRKAEVGPMDLRVTRLGASRRFASWQATATQDGREVLVAMASVGDRDRIDGPAWSDVDPWRPSDDELSPPAGAPELAFTVPPVAERFHQRIDLSTAGFATGHVGDHAQVRATIETGTVDQLTALVACDLAPPPSWNVLGMAGWVPTVELTAHVRSRPAAGPLTIDVATHHVRDGFLEEDALVHDAVGNLVVQSRQLARWTG